MRLNRIPILSWFRNTFGKLGNVLSALFVLEDFASMLLYAEADFDIENLACFKTNVTIEVRPSG